MTDPEVKIEFEVGLGESVEVKKYGEFVREIMMATNNAESCVCPSPPRGSSLLTVPPTVVAFVQFIESLYRMMDTNVLWLPGTSLPITKEVLQLLPVICDIITTGHRQVVSLGSGYGFIEWLLTIWCTKDGKPLDMVCFDNEERPGTRLPINFIRVDWTKPLTVVLPENVIFLTIMLPPPCHGLDALPCHEFVSVCAKSASTVIALGGLTNDICGCDEWEELLTPRSLKETHFKRNSMECLYLHIYQEPTI